MIFRSGGRAEYEKRDNGGECRDFDVTLAVTGDGDGC